MTRCGYLNHDGRQCRRPATKTIALHLEGEIYGFTHDPDSPNDVRDLATWVAVPLCRSHLAFGGSRVSRGKVQSDVTP